MSATRQAAYANRVHVHGMYVHNSLIVSIIIIKLTYDVTSASWQYFLSSGLCGVKEYRNLLRDDVSVYLMCYRLLCLVMYNINNYNLALIVFYVTLD